MFVLYDLLNFGKFDSNVSCTCKFDSIKMNIVVYKVSLFGCVLGVFLLLSRELCNI